MTLPIELDRVTSRKATLAKARQSRRPSRLGMPAGAAAGPDYLLDGEAGFPDLLKQVWEQALAAPGRRAALNTLLTLDGHVPAHIQRQALRIAEAAAVEALGADGLDRLPPADQVAFGGEIALTTSGRLALRVPGEPSLAGEETLVGGVLRVPWSTGTLAAYRTELARAAARESAAVASCRSWLATLGAQGRRDVLELLKDAARRTAPFVLYQERRQYTNFRDRNTLTGKTLWPGHPDCALSSLVGLPLGLWPDNDAVVVTCLTLLVRSGGYGRIEEVNGTQLRLDHVAALLERTRLRYNGVSGGEGISPAAGCGVPQLLELADALGRRSGQVRSTAKPYREIFGPLMHKNERVAEPFGEFGRQRETDLCAHLSRHLPVSGSTLSELTAAITVAPDWLGEPLAGFGTGLEGLIYETVRGSMEVFEADFAMSRGMRSLPALIAALRAEDWRQIAEWDIPHYFCCVVPAPDAAHYFGNSVSHLADTAWAMSARMQYNSWHFLAGNMPPVPEIVARDYFVPPKMPDIAYYSDQHHHGHVAARVRFTIRSPQAVTVLGRVLYGFADLRLLRCEGLPFGEQDLLCADRASAFIAAATSVAAEMAASGRDIEVTAFDSEWHWNAISRSVLSQQEAHAASTPA